MTKVPKADTFNFSEEIEVTKLNNSDANRLLTTAEAASYINYTPRFLEARRIRGGGPKFVRISGRAVRYRLEDLNDWIESRLVSNTVQRVED